MIPQKPTDEWVDEIPNSADPDSLHQGNNAASLTIPLISEQLQVSKQVIETGRVKLIKTVHQNIGNKANPIHINFHEFIDMVNDVRRARRLRQKLFYFYGSPIAVALKKQQLAQLNDGLTDKCIEQPVQSTSQY